MIYLLLLLSTMLFLLAFFISKEDILAPSVIVCLMWMFSAICAIYNIDDWGISLHSNTIEVIVIGLLSFIVGGWIGNNMPTITCCKKTKKKVAKERAKLSVISVWKPVLFFLIFINCLTVAFQLKWVFSQVGSISTWSETMTAYRSGSSSWNTDSVSKPSMLSNMEILLQVTAYLMTYIGLNNIFAEKKIKRNLLCFIPGILFAVDKILNAGRGDILLYIGAIMLTVYICMQTKYEWRKQISRKYIKYMLIAVVLVTVLFSVSRSWVGRTNESGMLEYVTTYAGGSIQLFDLYMQDPEPPSDVFGKETFHTLINYLGKKMNHPEWQYIAHLEFRYSNGVNLGNVYGAFRYYLYDFGLTGVVVLSLLAAVFYSYMYRRIQTMKLTSVDGFSWKVLVYMYFAPSLFMFSIADYTYALLFNFVALIKWFVLAWLIKRVLVNRNFPVKI